MSSHPALTEIESQRIRDFLDSSPHQTPYVVIDIDTVKDRYRRLVEAFGDTPVYYAVKANPQKQVIRTLVELGASFDVASPAEVDLCLSQGAQPQSLSYGNPVKKPADIRHAFGTGVRLFVFDSPASLHSLAEHAPGASVFCRILASSTGAQWPLSRKFGCSPEMATALLAEARTLGLRPVGLSFHVGSQQLDPSRWDHSIAQAARVFSDLRRQGIALRMLNVGGGFPVRYSEPVAPIDTYAERIRAALRLYFGATPPSLAIEPGRFVAAEAGVLRAQVVQVSYRSFDEDRRWVYLDVGRFGGLAETEGEAIRYRIVTGHDGLPAGPVVLAGPTCDSVDILYERTPYELPLALQQGDYVSILSAGAYTETYSSIGFNGFPPLTTFCIGDGI